MSASVTGKLLTGRSSDKPGHPSDSDILVNDHSYQPPLVSMIADNEVRIYLLFPPRSELCIDHADLVHGLWD